MKIFISTILNFLIKTCVLYRVPPNVFYLFIIISLAFSIFSTILRFTATYFGLTFLWTTSSNNWVGIIRRYVVGSKIPFTAKVQCWMYRVVVIKRWLFKGNKNQRSSEILEGVHEANKRGWWQFRKIFLSVRYISYLNSSNLIQFELGWTTLIR